MNQQNLLYNKEEQINLNNKNHKIIILWFLLFRLTFQEK
ncbi:hypothetical protein FM106_03725 [Brachybacterium faecium]|nr:hypothetical protein FM106_03725 [Brachybacterium faecium]